MHESNLVHVGFQTDYQDLLPSRQHLTVHQSDIVCFVAATVVKSHVLSVAGHCFCHNEVQHRPIVLGWVAKYVKSTLQCSMDTGFKDQSIRLKVFPKEKVELIISVTETVIHGRFSAPVFALVTQEPSKHHLLTFPRRRVLVVVQSQVTTQKVVKSWTLPTRSGVSFRTFYHSLHSHTKKQKKQVHFVGAGVRKCLAKRHLAFALQPTSMLAS